MTTRTIKVDTLTRVEGEGALSLRIENGALAAAELRIYEPPRLFEAVLRGRSYMEVPDIVSRICGICPIAYQTSAVQAIESAFGATVDGQLAALRRLIYCGEWIESHALHIVMLHAPDFLGFPDGIQMAGAHGEAVRAGLAVKKAGNELMRIVGGREIHPVNVKPGGFYRLPTKAELAAHVGCVARRAGAGRRAGALGCRVLRSRISRGIMSLSPCMMARPTRSSVTRLVSSAGLDIPISAFEEEFEERHVEHSTALHAVLKRRGNYVVGPLARYALNSSLLPVRLQALACEAGLGPVCRNPFKSIIVRALEVAYACGEALRLIAAYEPPAEAAVTLQPQRGRWLRLHRGAARHLLAPLRVRGRWQRGAVPASCRPPRRTSRASRPT